MSDTLNHTADNPEVDAFVAVHRDAGPDQPTEDALNRVRAEAQGRAGRRIGFTPAARPVWRVAGALIALVAVASVTTWVLMPRFDDSAFARAKAVAALAPEEGIFHSRSVYTATGRNDEFGEDPVRRQVWEEWVDFDAQQARGVVTEVDDGGVTELRIQSDGTVRTYAANFKLDEKKKQYVRLHAEQLIEEKAGRVESGMGGLVAGLREAIDNGDADVVAIVEEDGVPCWVIEWEVPGQDGGDPTYVKARMLTTDYALKQVSIEVSGKNGNGHWSGKDEWICTAWEYVERDSLPADFFDLEQTNKLARPDTPIERR